MAWLRRARRAPALIRSGEWRTPMLVWLAHDPDPLSATALRLTAPLSFGVIELA